MKSSRMTTYIVVATHKLFAGYVSFGSMIFLRLIKMIIAPLVFSTLVTGIGHMSDAGAVGRVGGKAMLWFVCASLVSLTLGLILVNPGPASASTRSSAAPPPASTLTP